MPNYKITISAFATVVVKNAASEDEAMEFATENIDYGDLQLDEGDGKGEIANEDLASHERHADLIFDARRYDND